VNKEKELIVVEVFVDKLEEGEAIVNTIVKVAEKLRELTVKTIIKDIFDDEVISRYGILVSPSIAVNGVLMAVGYRPSEGDFKDMLLRATMRI